MTPPGKPPHKDYGTPGKGTPLARLKPVPQPTVEAVVPRDEFGDSPPTDVQSQSFVDREKMLDGRTPRQNMRALYAARTEHEKRLNGHDVALAEIKGTLDGLDGKVDIIIGIVERKEELDNAKAKGKVELEHAKAKGAAEVEHVQAKEDAKTPNLVRERNNKLLALAALLGTPLGVFLHWLYGVLFS